MQRFNLNLATLLSGLCIAVSAAADQLKSENDYLGVASCASSTCHGSNVPFAASNVLQNEFHTWNESDPHSRAYTTLLSDRSQKIAQNLGLASAANAPECLGCHSSNMPTARQGAQFDISAGVDCETCHGAAEHYLSSHTRATHKENKAAGLIPLEDPSTRAQLCVSCHIGNSSDRKITHEIMGAGHPRLSFELNTFSSIQPAHFEVDADYIQRKGPVNEVQLWATGQLVASQQQLQNIQAFPRSGLFPELAHMDCLGCHQPMSKIDWAKNPLTPLAPGALRYNDAHLITSYQIAKAVAPELAPRLQNAMQTFVRQGPAERNPERVLNNLRDYLNAVEQAITQHPIDASQEANILASLIESGLKASFQGYGAAEQSAMAINSVLKVMSQTHMQENAKIRLLTATDAMFATLENPQSYRPTAFRQSLEEIKRATLP